MSDLAKRLQENDVPSWNAWRTTHTEPLDFAGRKLSGVESPGADLRKTNFRRADLSGANLAGADLTGADLTGADLTGADLTRTNLTEAVLTDANLAKANLSGANLRGGVLMKAHLHEAHLTRAWLDGALMSQAELHKANFTGASLRNANLSRSDLTEAQLIDASLFSADLSRANLTQASLINATLLGANVIGANLTRTNLNSANLLGADLRGANFFGADLTRAALLPSLDLTNLTDAKGLASTYIQAQSILDQVYTPMKWYEAVLLRRNSSQIVAIAFSLVWLVSWMLHYANIIFPSINFLFPQALAAPPSSHALSPANFVPPLGLNQNLYDIVLFTLLFMTVCIICVLLYSGFLSNKKSQRAATLIEHFGSFLLGAFFGTRIG